MSHGCPIHACRIYDVSDHRLMCFRHWNLIPLPLQKTIVRLYASGKKFDGYEEACANAKAQVEEKLATTRTERERL